MAGTFCLGTSTFYPTLPLALILYAGSIYYVCQHPVIAYKYHSALNDLANYYQQLMHNDSAPMQEKLHNEFIQKLILTLGPHLNSEVLQVWTKTDLEPLKNCRWFVAALPVEFSKQIEDFYRGNHKLSLDYLWYGQGNEIIKLGAALKRKICSFSKQQTISALNFLW